MARFTFRRNALAENAVCDGKSASSRPQGCRHRYPADRVPRSALAADHLQFRRIDLELTGLGANSSLAPAPLIAVIEQALRVDFATAPCALEEFWEICSASAEDRP
jgi:hypothetical protein